jgi:hypothetical protein
VTTAPKSWPQSLRTLFFHPEASSAAVCDSYHVKGDLLLDVVVSEPQGPAAEVMTDVPVRYQEAIHDMFGTGNIA